MSMSSDSGVSPTEDIEGVKHSKYILYLYDHHHT
jgi:hypothetical protein